MERKCKNINRYTVCLPPKDLNDSYQKVSICVDLAKPAILSTVVGIPYAIQKPCRSHLVMAHSLHNTAHLVTGDFGLAQIVNLLGKHNKAIIFGNEKDHLFDSKHPHQPVVLNTDKVPGISESTLMLDLFQQTTVPCVHASLEIITSLRAQVALEMETGLQKLGDEIVMLGKLDGRSTWCLHAGITPIQAKAWNRMGGHGIARPGMMMGKVSEASPALRRFSARMSYLLTHVFIHRVLNGTSRENQGNPSKVRKELASDWYDWLQAKPSDNIRISDTITFALGNGTTVHFDALNDPRLLFDHITWAVNYVDELSTHLSLDSILALSSAGVETTKVAFTVLAYPRAIMGSASDRIEHISNVHCPLFKSISYLLNSHEFHLHDVSHLESTDSRNQFLCELTKGKRKEAEKDYKGFFVTRHETMTRDVLLGSLLHVWMLLVHCYLEWITLGHLEQYVVFIGFQINGSMLIYQVISELISWKGTPREKKITKILAAKGNTALFVLLSKLLIERKNSVYPSSTHPRWQPGGRFIYVTEGDEWRVELLMNFVTGCLASINASVTALEVEEAMKTLGSTVLKQALGYTAEQIGFLQYGPVHTTFTIQVASFFGVIGPEHGSYSEIEKGKSGYYRCVNSHHEDSAGHPLSTSEAREAVDEVISTLLSTGHLVDKSITDQVCCHWNRAQTNRLKNDVYFWDLHSGKLMDFYRRKSYKNGNAYRIEIFYKNHWRSLSDYAPPFYQLDNTSSSTKYNFNTGHSKNVAKWVRDLEGPYLYSDI